MDKFCEDCIHNEVCQYGSIPPHIGRCNDKETLEDLKEKIETYKDAYRIMSDAFECEVTKNTRPKGEWARHDYWRGGEYIGGFYHVNCPCEDGYYSKWRTNFCPNCGLPMQKGGAK